MKKHLFKLVLVLLSSQVLGQSEINYYEFPNTHDFPSVNYVFEGKDHLIIRSNHPSDLISGHNRVVIFNIDNTIETKLVQNVADSGNIEIVNIKPRVSGSDLLLIGSYFTDNFTHGYKRLRYNPSSNEIAQVDTLVHGIGYDIESVFTFLGDDNILIQSFGVGNHREYLIVKYDVLNNQVIDTFNYKKNYVYAIKPLPNNEFLAFTEHEMHVQGLRVYRFNAFNEITDSLQLNRNYDGQSFASFIGHPSIGVFQNKDYLYYLEKVYHYPMMPTNEEMNLVLQQMTPEFDSIISLQIIDNDNFGLRTTIANAGFLNYNDEYLYLIHTINNSQNSGADNFAFGATEYDANKIRITKTDGQKVLWKKDFGLPEKFHSVTKSFKGVDGSLIIAGVTQEDGMYFRNEPFILKIDTAGNPIFLTGVKELEANKNGFTIYPNPAENTLQTSLAFKSYRIFDQSGRLILQANKNENQIDVSNLKPGLYFLNIENLNGQLLTEKFMKM